MSDTESELHFKRAIQALILAGKGYGMGPSKTRPGGPPTVPERYNRMLEIAEDAIKTEPK